jgi:hypothetical protein
MNKETMFKVTVTIVRIKRLIFVEFYLMKIHSFLPLLICPSSIENT